MNNFETTVINGALSSFYDAFLVIFDTFINVVDAVLIFCQAVPLFAF